MFFFFFFKQKTAYEMRISDWSSDVCSSDLSTVTGVVTVCLALGFLMPSTMSRVILLLPIVLALAERLGYPDGSRGRTGLVVAVGFGSYFGPVAILPATVPTNVVTGAADVFYGVPLQYFYWLLIHFPVARK